MENKKSVYFKDIIGNNVLLFTGVGFWKERILAQLPESTVILVKDNEKLNLIAQHSDLAAFSSDVAIRHNVTRPRRMAIPVLDEAAYTDYYCICKKTNKEMVKFINNIAAILPGKLSYLDFPAQPDE